MILIFDLDDTLYPEIEFVLSGFKEVSLFVEKDFGIQSSFFYKDMLLELTLHGRGSIFNNVLKKYNIFSLQVLRKCIRVYRSHSPDIEIYPEARNCLLRFKEHRKYIVTDGNLIVQRNKIKALGLKSNFVKTIPTHQYGLNSAKPSVLIFEKIIRFEKCKANDLVYIGDNPNKDFVNIKKIGLRTVRVLTGGFKNLIVNNEYEAEFKIENLNYLTIDFIKKLSNENR